MKKLFLIFFISSFAVTVFSQNCVDCHKTQTPNIVADWKLSKHSANGIDCSVCHGDKHTSASDVNKVLIPTAETCAPCHEDRVKQFKSGKHALAWTSMNALPMTHNQPMALIEGLKGCGGCHKLGIKSDEDFKKLKKEGRNTFGVASCDACHTRHLFSREEAKQPQACITCHQGFDHPQWEMYSTAKHGVRYLLKQTKTIPETSAAPTCQTCHMPDGNHEVRTAWGFLALRLPMPNDKEWEKDRTVILKGLGVLDPDGKPTARFDLVKSADVVRLNQESWQKERDKMLNVCKSCHSENFAKDELEKGDEMIKRADHLMAQAIEIVAGLYKDGLLKKPKEYPYAYPDLLAFHDASTSIEQKLFVMFLEHRNRAFQGAFHINPDYAFWYGWSEMIRDLTEIKEKAEELRK